MPRPGGEADKLGNHYEGLWAIDAALDLINGKALDLTVEALGDEAAGVEFVSHGLELESVSTTPSSASNPKAIGRSLGSRVRRRGTSSRLSLIRTGADCCCGLQFKHERRGVCAS